VSPDGSSTGSFAEESARLLEAFQTWSAKGRAAASDASQNTAGHSPDCGVCPICQGMAVLRGAKPEVVDHLADALTSLAAAVSALLPSGGTGPSERRTAEPAEHIDVSGDDATDATDATEATAGAAG
jgi:hypothetical protein